MNTVATEYKTSDMALAVFLNLRGHCHSRLERDGRRCLWVFIVVGELLTLVEHYLTEEAVGDVQDVIETSKRLREEMYDHMKATRN